MIKSRVLFILVIISMISLLGCNKSSTNSEQKSSKNSSSEIQYSTNVNSVRKSTMMGYQTTTIGNAFDYTFDNPKWSEVKGKKGENIVQFSGNISKNLHDTVLNEANKDFVGKQDYQLLQIYDIYMQAGIRTYGKDSDFIKGLNEKYGCTLDGNEVIAYYLNCKGDQGMYAKEVTDTVLNDAWKVGEPVQVQWVIFPDGKSFELYSMEAKSWKGLKQENILKMIYK